MRGASFGATMAIFALLIHSAVDLNLQIPANALTWMVVLALAWVARHYPTGAKAPLSRRPNHCSGFVSRTFSRA